MVNSESVSVTPVEVHRHSESDSDVVILHNSTADAPKQSSVNQMYPEKLLKRPLKRKRVTIDMNIGLKEKEKLINRFHEELDGLFKYFNGVLAWNLGQEEGECCSINSAMACMLEGSNLPFSALAEKMYQKLRAREGVTLPSVQRDLHFISSRLNYGIDNGNLNLLEDESESSLWCWEVRDLKLLPKNKRKISIAQRKGREKVRDRVAALSEMISVLSMPDSQGNQQAYWLEASEKLGRTLSLEDICLVFQKLTQKTADEIAEKENKSKERELLKDIERNMRIAEKEKKKLDRQLEKEKSQSERELKRCQMEADKQERRREKEEAELKKHQRRQQEEAERDQKRREKEDAEARKLLSIKKQASIMQRFLKSKKCNGLENQADKISKNVLSSDYSGRNGDMEESVILSMDSVLFRRDGMNIEELWKSHITAWHGLRHSNRCQHWGVRHKPKTVVSNELKLQRSSCKHVSLGSIKAPKTGNALSDMNGNDKSDSGRFADDIEEDSAHNQSCDNDDAITLIGIQFSRRDTKFLQFDKSYRPAYYGSWSKKSSVIGPRHPFAKEPVLDYDVDSDEEWEEEEPGESLSDCDKDEDEILEENPKADDEEESEDSFFVPDGYLSENEGAQDDSMVSDAMSNEARGSSGCWPEIENEECSALLHQQNYLVNLTQQALRKNQPLIIMNLLHEKSQIVMTKDLTGTLKVEQICLQTLCLVACSEDCIIEQPFINRSSEVPDVCQCENSNNTAYTAAAGIISDPNLLEYVHCIQANPNGLAKVLESLQGKFPSLPKAQLRNRVREISEFINNRWQVKKEVLEKLGMSESPYKGRQLKGISNFFSSKRCLPPTGEVIDLSETSPQACLKSGALGAEDIHHECQENLQIHIT